MVYRLDKEYPSFGCVIVTHLKCGIISMERCKHTIKASCYYALLYEGLFLPCVIFVFLYLQTDSPCLPRKNCV